MFMLADLSLILTESENREGSFYIFPLFPTVYYGFYLQLNSRFTKQSNSAIHSGCYGEVAQKSFLETDGDGVLDMLA